MSVSHLISVGSSASKVTRRMEHVDSPLVDGGAEAEKPALKPFTSHSVAHKGLSSDSGKACGSRVGQNL